MIQSHDHPTAEASGYHKDLHDFELRMQLQHRALTALARSEALRGGDIAQALRQITETACRTLEIARSSIWLYNEDKHHITCQDLCLHSGESCRHEAGAILESASYPAYFAAIAEERTIAAHNAHDHEATHEFSASYLTPLGIVSMLDAPIIIAGEMIGVVCMEHIGEPRHWAADEQNFVGSIADMVAMATESNHRRAIQQQLEEQVNQVSALIEVSRSLTSELDLHALLRKVIDECRDVVDAEAGSLLLLEENESGERYRFHFVDGGAAQQILNLTLNRGQGIAGWVAESGEGLLVPDAYLDPRFDPTFDQKTGFRTQSIIAVPLLLKNKKVIGVLEAINKRTGGQFDHHDLKILQSFANMSSVAIDNARLVSDLRESLQKERRLSIEKEKMRAYIPQQAVDEITHSRESQIALGGKVVDATVMFSDIKGFTSLSEKMKATNVVAFLNEYMTAMADIVAFHAGVVDKFIGDGLMAVFLPSTLKDNHALRAVRAGIQMQKELAGIKEGWQSRRPEVKDIGIRIGINSGEMVAGNIGSQSRMEYTVIGDNVNVASRIESNGQVGEVLVGEATYLRVRSQGVRAERLEPLFVKNREQQVDVYRIMI